MKRGGSFASCSVLPFPLHISLVSSSAPLSPWLPFMKDVTIVTNSRWVGILYQDFSWISLGVTQLWAEGEARTKVSSWHGEDRIPTEQKAESKWGEKNAKIWKTRWQEESLRAGEIRDHAGGSNDALVWVFWVFARLRKWPDHILQVTLLETSRGWEERKWLMTIHMCTYVSMNSWYISILVEYSMGKKKIMSRGVCMCARVHPILNSGPAHENTKFLFKLFLDIHFVLASLNGINYFKKHTFQGPRELLWNYMGSGGGTKSDSLSPSFILFSSNNLNLIRIVFMTRFLRGISRFSGILHGKAYFKGLKWSLNHF